MMKKYSGILFPSLLFLILFSGTASSQTVPEPAGGPPPGMSELATVHERFVYNVRYGFLNLGEVEVTITPDTTYQGQEAIHIRTVMTTNHRLLFVGRREIHYQSFSGYSEEWPFSYVFWRDDLHEDVYETDKIVFNRTANLVRFFEEGEKTAELELEEPASGGDIIFLFSRMFAGTDESYSLPVYIDDETGMVTAGNSPETEQRSYDAFPEPVDAYYSEGYADIDGPFGFTGEFRAWFATDDLRLPLEAHARIIFGNVRLQLTDYERYE